MFGFDEVATFTHEFEIAFDPYSEGKIKPIQDLIWVSLTTKDYIRALIEAPESTDSSLEKQFKQFIGLRGIGSIVKPIRALGRGDLTAIIPHQAEKTSSNISDVQQGASETGRRQWLASTRSQPPKTLSG